MTGPVKVSSISPKLTQIGRHDFRRLAKTLPKDLQIGRAFSASAGKLIVIQKGFSAPQVNAVVSALKDNAWRLPHLRTDVLCVLNEKADGSLVRRLGKNHSVIILRSAQSPRELKARVYMSFLDSSPDVRAEEHSVLLRVSSSDPGQKLNSRRIHSAVQRALDPVSYHAERVKTMLGEEYDTGNIKEALESMPKDLLEGLAPEQIGNFVKACVKHKKTGKDCVMVFRKRVVIDDKPVVTAEVLILKDDYFGLSHDLASILKSAGLSPLDMRFDYLKGETTKILCRCSATFSTQVLGSAQLGRELERLLKEDSEKRAPLVTEGEKLKFSYVSLFFSIARLLVSVSPDRYSIDRVDNALKNNGSITLNIIKLLRVKADPVYHAEHPLLGKEDKEYLPVQKKIDELAASGKADDADILKFALDLVRAVKKTDYFDYNRVKEIFTFVIDFSFLQDYFRGRDLLYPAELVYVYRRNAPIEVLFHYASERMLKAGRYTDVNDIETIPDPVLSSILEQRGSVRAKAVAKAAEAILPDPQVLSGELFRMFEKIRFTGPDGNDFGVHGLKEGSYLASAAAALFNRVGGDGLSHEEDVYVNDIAARNGVPPSTIERVEMAHFRAGGLKDLSLVKIYSKATPITFLAGVNLLHVYDREKGHTWSEHSALVENSGKTDLLPRPFGFSLIEGKGQKLGVILKEYLRGMDGLEYLGRKPKQSKIADLFFAAGRAIGMLYGQIEQGSSDYKLANMIYHDDIIRFCDIAPLTDDIGEVAAGIKQLYNEVPPGSNDEFFRGILAASEKGREFLARIRVNLMVDEVDAWASNAFIKAMDKYARSVGKVPDEFYSYTI